MDDYSGMIINDFQILRKVRIGSNNQWLYEAKCLVCGYKWISTINHIKRYNHSRMPHRHGVQIDPNYFIGKQFGNWYIDSFCGYTNKNGRRRQLFNVICSCGVKRVMPINNIQRSTNKTHRHPVCTGNWSSRKLRNKFFSMIGRCYRKSDSHYESYGGRGIKICDEWLKKSSIVY